jgi:hypothetical protein
MSPKFGQTVFLTVYFQVCFKEKQSRDTNPAPAPASPVLPTDEKIIEKPTMPSSSCKYPQF